MRETPTTVDLDNSEDELDDDFSTFRIYSSYEGDEEESPNKSKGRWVAQDEKLKICGRQLEQGFIYFGGVLDSLAGHGVEPSLVDEKRPVSPTGTRQLNSVIHSDDSLGYWPSYASLSKECRGAYLDWLASDRSTLNTPIGYVFIYFYGFERRIIENKDNSAVSDDEFLAIYNEVSRLRKIYEESHSFLSYSANFLELMVIIRPALFQNKHAALPSTSNALAFKLALAKAVVAEEPINADLALEWLKSTHGYSLKMPARRCELEFKTLFNIKCEDKFGPDGIKVKPNKTKLVLSYHPASSSVRHVNFNFDNLPDPSVLKGPIKRLIPIADACTEELNSYSRYLGRSDSSRDDIAAVMLLPDKLANELNSPVFEKFKSWADGVIEVNDGLTSVKDFWSHIGSTIPKAINKKENELILNLAAKAGFGIAPDFRFHHAKLQPDGNVVLFKPGHREYSKPSKALYQADIALRLGVMVASVDGYVDIREKQALSNLINHDEKLSPTEKSSLGAYLTWRLNTPINMSGLKSRLEKLSRAGIQFVSKFLVSVAHADGKVDASEIKRIEKLYKALGLDESLVTSDIHNLVSSKAPSFLSSVKLSPYSGTSFNIDEAALAHHESETSDAQSMLESIFTADDELDDVHLTEDMTSSAGLDKAHANLYGTLVKKEEWQRNEVFGRCKELNLMVDGAIEVINDWAFENVNAPVLDDEGDIYVDFQIVEELRGQENAH